MIVTNFAAFSVARKITRKDMLNLIWPSKGKHLRGNLIEERYA